MKHLAATEKIFSKTEFDFTVSESNKEDKKTVRLWDLNKRACCEILLYINNQTKQDKSVFNLVENCMTIE